MITLLTSLFISLVTVQHSESHIAAPASNACKRGKDTLTGRTVYFTADTDPECEGGKAALLRNLNINIKLSDTAVTNEIKSQFVVGFIVEKNGEITGERIIQDDTNEIGKQLLKSIRSCRWHPAKCNGKNVAMLYKFSITIDTRKN